MFKNKTILITGGTGSFGQAFTKYLFDNFKDIKKVIIFSRDEQKQFSMSKIYSTDKYPIKYLLGDVRDKERVFEVTKNVDIVIHSAAMKHVPASEQNPMEAIKTNILGSENLIKAAKHNSVKQFVALSTDKAASPVNTYGATKFLLEKLFVFANFEDNESNTNFSVVRYGNIFGSKGSVVPFFLKQKENKVLTITDENMTRFSITLQESIDLVMYALKNAQGGEIIVPVAPSYKIMDVAKAVCSESKYEITGIRKGEKLYELMYTKEESFDTVRRDNFYIIYPTQSEKSKEQYCTETGANEVEVNKEYNSATNNQWLTVDEIKSLIESEEIM